MNKCYENEHADEHMMVHEEFSASHMASLINTILIVESQNRVKTKSSWKEADHNKCVQVKMNKLSYSVFPFGFCGVVTSSGSLRDDMKWRKVSAEQTFIICFIYSFFSEKISINYYDINCESDVQQDRCLAESLKLPVPEFLFLQDCDDDWTTTQGLHREHHKKKNNPRVTFENKGKLVI